MASERQGRMGEPIASHGPRARRAAAAALLLALLGPWEAAALDHTWSGGGADANWSNPANWDGAGPSDNEVGASLTFPALGGHYDSHNDLSGVHVNLLSVTTALSDGDYTFSGNPLRLEGPSILGSPGTGEPNLLWRIPLTLGANVTIAASGRQTRLEGDIDLGDRTLTLNVGGDLVLAGVVSGSGGIIKNNTSALTILGTNTYTGATTCNGGALYIAGAGAFGDGATGATFAGGFLGFSPGSAFTLVEPLRFTGGRVLAYGTPTIGGPVTVDAATDVTAFQADSVLTITSPIDGSGGLTTRGAGRVVLGGASTFAGTTRVAEGALQLDGSLASTAGVTVASGAILRGHGSTAGAIGVEAGGTLAPGGSPGALAGAGLTMVAGATLAAEIDGPAAASQYDQVAVGGPVSLDGATLSLALGYAPADGQAFTVIAQAQGQAVSGSFAGLPEGATFVVDGTTFGITYAGGSGHDVVLIAAPDTITPPPASATPSPTPTPTPVGEACAGDCDGDGAVGINELITGVNIALGNDGVDSCPAFDVDGDGTVAIQELIAAVNNALGGCR